MSNEKLGAEQGRALMREQAVEFAERWFDRKWGNDGQYQSLMETMVKRLMELEPADQAYHARGAGLESIDGENQTHGMVVRNLTMLVRRLIHRIRSKYKAPDDVVAKQAWDYLMGEGLHGSVLRAPGADTGTTPPKDRMYIPRSIPVTDDGLDAPDGAEYTVTFKRVGGAWERIDVAAERGTTPLRVTDVHGTASETGDSQAGYPEAGSIPVGAVNIPETQDFLLRELVTEWRYLAGEGERFDKDPVRRFQRAKDANYLVREAKRLRQCALQVEDILSKRAATQPDAACEGCISNGVEPHASFCTIEGRVPVERDKCE